MQLGAPKPMCQYAGKEVTPGPAGGCNNDSLRGRQWWQTCRRKDIRPWWSSTRKFNTLRPRQKGQHCPDDVFIHRKLTWYYVVASVIRRDKLLLKPILTETTDTLTKIRIFEFSWDSPYFTSNKVATIWRRMADIFRIQSDPHGCIRYWQVTVYSVKMFLKTTSD